MIWNICFAASVIILVAAIALTLYRTSKNKGGKLLSPFNVIFAGVFLSVFTGLIPVEASLLTGETWVLLKLLLFNALQTIQVFTINVGADLILENINATTTEISGIYSAFMTCLFFAAPILTFGFLLSLIKNLLVSVKYRFLHYTGDVYAFSSLNEKALLLADDIRKNHKKAVIVFTDTENCDDSLIDEAKNLNAIISTEDICAFDFASHSKKASLIFIVSSEDESKNINCSLKLLEQYNDRENTDLYAFSSSADGEFLLSNADKGKIHLRRINEIRSQIYSYLYDSGTEIFDNAVSINGKKEINIVLAGLGLYGTEMLKALSWYCQMTGYSFNIYVFDKDESVQDRFTYLCPELMPESYYGRKASEEHSYNIRFFTGIDTETNSFSEIFRSLSDISYVFIALGDDRKNISQSAAIRILSERKGENPVIRTVVYDRQADSALEGISNHKGQSYRILTIGNMKRLYSEEILLGTELEKIALERHLKWDKDKEDEFWRYDYNYRSSMASAIHREARIHCKVQPEDLDEDNLTEELRDIIEPLEHKRWNAYVRSEGYVYSGSTDKESRNDLAKMHNALIDFNALSEEEKRKDSIIAAK